MGGIPELRDKLNERKFLIQDEQHCRCSEDKDRQLSSVLLLWKVFEYIVPRGRYLLDYTMRTAHQQLPAILYFENPLNQVSPMSWARAWQLHSRRLCDVEGPLREMYVCTR